MEQTMNATNRLVHLPTGVLSVEVDTSELPLDDLCGFAARQNPKRGFLFVSRVLGKHIPVRPAKMRDVYRRLAARIPTDLPGPVVVVGMAETAIALGNGVFDEYKRLSGRADVMYIHTTRYRLDAEPALCFLEEHSHAADHILYYPVDAAMRSLFVNARSLVLVDDEASTGKTFLNLAAALKPVCRHVNDLTTVVITDWRGVAGADSYAAAGAAQLGMPVRPVALLYGRYQFTPAPNLHMVQMPKAVGDDSLKDSLLPENFGRFGLRHSRLPKTAAALMDHQASGRFLIAGTGEFAYPPLLLAEALEERNPNLELYVQSTTRSPIMVGDAIGCKLEFTDNYGDGIANYLYNARRSDYDGVVVCSETPIACVDTRLVEALSARLVQF